MSAVECLRRLVNERLTAAAEEILGVFIKTIVEYEEEIDRQRRLLDVVLKPEIGRLQRTDQEEVLLGHQPCNQQRNFSLGQEDSEPPHIKKERKEVCTSHDEGEQPLLQEEADTFDLTSACDGHRTDPPQPSVVEEEVLLVQQHSNQQRSFSLRQEHSEPPQIKEEWEEVCTSHDEGEEPLLQEADTYDLTSTCDGSDHSEHQSLHSDPYQTQSVAEKESLANISFNWAKSESDREESAVPEPDSDHQLLSHNWPVVESQSYKTSSVGSAAATRTKPKAFPQRSVLKRDMESTQTQKPFRYGISGKGFTSQHSLAPHLRMHTGKKPYSCANCGKEFADRSSLKRHLIIHTGDKPYQCLLCGKRFNLMSTLKRHTRTHTGQKPHTCSTCGKSFAEKFTLKEHMMIHTGEKPYTCGFCGRGFTRSSNLKKHITVHTSAAHSSRD